MSETHTTLSTPSEEDSFWERQHAEIESRALDAFAKGTVGRGRAAAQLAELRATRESGSSSIDLDPADANLALHLAKKHGLDYQAYVRKLVHEAIERELALTEK